MANPIWFPNSATLLAKLEQPEGDDITVNVDGVTTYRRVYRGNFVFLKANMPVIRSLDPNGAYNGRATTISLSREKPDLGVLVVEYTGSAALPLPTYELVASQHEVPITYHPDFPDWTDYILPTTVKDPETLTWIASFEKFREFGSNNKFRGIEAYWLAAAVWRKTQYTYTPDTNFSNLFKLDAPETGGNPLPDSSNTLKSWIRGDKSSRNLYRGASPIWETQEAWLYNPNGWLSEIYG